MSDGTSPDKGIVQFSSFAFSNTGLVKSQTILKIEDYSLICVPMRFSSSQGVLLAYLSREEIAFFQRFAGGLAGLSLTVQRAFQQEPEKIFVRAQIAKVGMMKDKEGVGLFVLSWKPLPPALGELLERQLELLARLRAEAGDWRGRSVRIDPNSAKQLGYNNYAVLRRSSGPCKLALFAIAVDGAEFLVPLREPDIPAGDSALLDLYFLKYRFSVPALVEESSRLPSGIQRAKARLSFSPELVHILEEYFAGNRR